MLPSRHSGDQWIQRAYQNEGLENQWQNIGKGWILLSHWLASQRWTFDAWLSGNRRLRRFFFCFPFAQLSNGFREVWIRKEFWKDSWEKDPPRSLLSHDRSWKFLRRQEQWRQSVSPCFFFCLGPRTIWRLGKDDIRLLPIGWRNTSILWMVFEKAMGNRVVENRRIPMGMIVNWAYHLNDSTFDAGKLDWEDFIS